MSTSDHARVAGTITQTIEFAGKTYTLKPYRVGLWAEMSAFVRSQKGDPIKAVCDRWASIPSGQRDQWMESAIRAATNQTPSEAEMAEFEKSLLGEAFKLWCVIKPECLEDFPTPIEVRDKLIEIGETEGAGKVVEILTKLHIVGGEADLKNSDGQPATVS